MPAVRTKNAREQAKQTAKAAVSAPVEARPVENPVRKRTSVTKDEKFTKALDKFTPGALDYLKENFGLDLRGGDLSVADMYDLAAGRFVSPVAVTVNPVAYDRETKKQVVCEPITVNTSLQVVFGIDDERRCVASDKTFVRSAPVRPFVLKGDDSPVVEGVGESVEITPDSAPEKKESVKLTDRQIMALESVGIRTKGFFSRYRPIGNATREALLAGLPVEMEGEVKVGTGKYHYVRFCAEVTMKGDSVEMDPVVMRTLADGSSIPALASVPKEEFEKYERQDFQADILEAVHFGDIDFDIYRRNKTTGNIMRTEDGTPLLNDAGKHLLSYGHTMGTVKGYTHDQYGNARPPKNYILSMVNGSVIPLEMKEEPVIGKDGSPKTVKVFDYESKKMVSKPVTVPVLPFDGIDGDGKIYVDRNLVSFVDDNEMRAYRSGRPARVDGLVYKSYNSKKGDEVYTGYVVYDPSTGGAHRFSPSTSEKIGKELNEAQKAVTSLKCKSFR